LSATSAEIVIEPIRREKRSHGFAVKSVYTSGGVKTKEAKITTPTIGLNVSVRCAERLSTGNRHNLSAWTTCFAHKNATVNISQFINGERITTTTSLRVLTTMARIGTDNGGKLWRETTTNANFAACLRVSTTKA